MPTLAHVFQDVGCNKEVEDQRNHRVPTKPIVTLLLGVTADCAEMLWQYMASFMNKLILNLMAALSLIMSAIAVHTANAQAVATQAGTITSIKIFALPCYIKDPGTYVLTKNLTFTSGNLAGINVITNVSGPVVIDLKGYTITGPGTPGTESVGVLIGNTGSTNTYPITIRNGTISNCSSGISVGERTDVTINNIVFYEPALLSNAVNVLGVYLERSSSSTVSNCAFSVTTTGVSFGIEDFESTGGNSYNNDTFVNVTWPLYVQGSVQGTLTLDRCQF